MFVYRALLQILNVAHRQHAEFLLFLIFFKELKIILIISKYTHYFKHHYIFFFTYVLTGKFYYWFNFVREMSFDMNKRLTLNIRVQIS